MQINAEADFVFQRVPWLRLGQFYATSLFCMA